MNKSHIAKNFCAKLLIVLTAAGVASAANAAAYIKFANLTGSSTAKGFEGWSQIDSYNWGVSQSGSTHTGGGGGAGKASFSDFSWTQALDSTFVPLFIDLAKGAHLTSAEVDFTRSTSSKPQFTFFTMTFSELLVSSLSIGGATDNSGIIPQAASINFAKIKISYQGLNPDGSLAVKQTASWNIAENRADSNFGTVFAMALSSGFVPSAVPEPETYAMMLGGLALIGFVARRRKSA